MASLSVSLGVGGDGDGRYKQPPALLRNDDAVAAAVVDAEDDGGGGGDGGGGVKSPHPHDVLCGRGGASNHHLGNLHYRALVDRCKPLYAKCPNTHKRIVALSVVEAIRVGQDPPGRFLERRKVSSGKVGNRSGSGAKKGENGGLWYEVTQDFAVEKTKQILRETRVFNSNKGVDEAQKNDGADARKGEKSKSDSADADDSSPGCGKARRKRNNKRGGGRPGEADKAKLLRSRTIEKSPGDILSQQRQRLAQEGADRWTSFEGVTLDGSPKHTRTVSNVGSAMGLSATSQDHGIEGVLVLTPGLSFQEGEGGVRPGHARNVNEADLATSRNWLGGGALASASSSSFGEQEGRAHQDYCSQQRSGKNLAQLGRGGPSATIDPARISFNEYDDAPEDALLPFQQSSQDELANQGHSSHSQQQLPPQDLSRQHTQLQQQLPPVPPGYDAPSSAGVPPPPPAPIRKRSTLSGAPPRPFLSSDPLDDDSERKLLDEYSGHNEVVPVVAGDEPQLGAPPPSGGLTTTVSGAIPLDQIRILAAGVGEAASGDEAAVQVSSHSAMRVSALSAMQVSSHSAMQVSSHSSSGLDDDTAAVAPGARPPLPRPPHTAPPVPLPPAGGLTTTASGAVPLDECKLLAQISIMSISDDLAPPPAPHARRSDSIGALRGVGGGLGDGGQGSLLDDEDLHHSWHGLAFGGKGGAGRGTQQELQHQPAAVTPESVVRSEKQLGATGAAGAGTGAGAATAVAVPPPPTLASGWTLSSGESLLDDDDLDTAVEARLRCVTGGGTTAGTKLGEKSQSM